MTKLEEFAKKGEAFSKESADGLKKLMRSRCREILEGVDDSYIKEASDAITSRVLGTEEYASAETIFCYMSMGREPQTDALIERALADGKRVCIPLCLDDHKMEAKLYKKGDELSHGAYGIREPLASAETVDPSEIDLGIIPCVACDRHGKRIGHGAGYYDRYLTGTEFHKMALCFEKLIMGNIPWYKTDVLMDSVATDENIYGRRWREERGKEAYILPLR
jgi:5-formyltetrahydrofolate cyclo-ligase